MEGNGKRTINTWSINSHKNNDNTSNLFHNVGIPTRVHDVCFGFKITSSLEDLRIQWKGMNKEQGHTVDLVKSPNYEKSVMLVHMGEVYTFNIHQELIRLYEAARAIAIQTADELHIEISARGLKMI